MLIGIDASRAVSDAPTGTETYSREMIRCLLQIDSKNEYRLYARRKASHDFLPSPHSSTINYEIRAIPFPRLWTHARLSLEMLMHPPDLLWVPAHVLPLVHPRHSIVTIHDLGNLYYPEAYPRFSRAYHRWSQEWSARAAEHIFADSAATKNDLVSSFGIAREKISVVYPAYDAQLYNPLPDPAVNEEVRSRLRVGRDYIISVGTIHPRKNYARLLEAFQKLGIDDCQLLIVGKKGWMYQEILANVERFGNQVKLLDYVPLQDMPVLISGAKLFVFPSLYEGFGLPVLEAQACGVPVVCSNSSSLPEAAGEGAIFFDPLDIGAMKDAIQLGLNDAAVRTRLIELGRENVKRFGWEKSARAALDAINRVAGVA